MDTQNFIGKKKFPYFNRIDKESADYIAQKVFNKYKSQKGTIDEQSVKNMIEDAYKIINKNHTAD